MTNRPITALIIEDEMPNFIYIKSLFEQNFPEFRVEGPLISITQVKTYFELGSKPDFIFTDIKLSDGFVFDAFSNIQVDIPVIFATAYDEFAIRAFNYNSVGYLLKPIDQTEFVKSVNKVMAKQLPSELFNLVTLSTIVTNKYRNRFLCSYKDSYVIVYAKEINHISLDNGETKLNLYNGKSYCIDLSMNDLEKQLDPDLFFRANRQYIIQSSAIKKLIVYWQRKLKVCLIDYPDVSIVVSKEKCSEIKKWLDK